MKKLFIIFVVLFIISLIFLGVYYLAFQDDAENTIIKEPTRYNKDAPSERDAETSNQFITQITQEAIIAPVITTGGGRIRYVNAENGSIEEIDLSGTNKETLFENNFTGIGAVAWSADREKILMQSVTNKDYYVFDIKNNTKSPFKENVDTATWTTSGNRVLYKYFNTDNKERSLNIANADGSDWKKILPLTMRDASFTQIPRSASVLLWNTGNAHEKSNLTSVGIVGISDPKKIGNKSFGADYLPSPDGKNILVSALEDEGGDQIILFLMNQNGGDLRPLNIPTFISKVAWSKDSNSLYYALSGGIPEGSLLPNDYRNKKFMTRDSFWKVTIETGQKERLIPLNTITQEYDATDLFLSPIEDTLFFVNRYDDQLYRLDIDQDVAVEDEN